MKNALQTNPSSIAYIIDDDAALRDALSFLLQSRGVAVKAYGSAESFLTSFSDQMRGCILTDVRMGGMSGLDMFDRLGTLQCKMPIIVLTGHGDVSMAVDALKNGVRDFVEKPFNTNNLVDKIIAAMEHDEQAALREKDILVFKNKILELSQRERDVMDLVLDGKLNKVIANMLDISMRTVEVHRSKIFSRMGVRSAVELVNLFNSMNASWQAHKQSEK